MNSNKLLLKIRLTFVISNTFVEIPDNWNRVL